MNGNDFFLKNINKCNHNKETKYNSKSGEKNTSVKCSQLHGRVVINISKSKPRKQCCCLYITTSMPFVFNHAFLYLLKHFYYYSRSHSATINTDQIMN